MRCMWRVAFCLIVALSGSLAAGAFESFPFPVSHESPDNVVSTLNNLQAAAEKDSILQPR